jgi:hypothetical protein
MSRREGNGLSHHHPPTAASEGNGRDCPQPSVPRPRYSEPMQHSPPTRSDLPYSASYNPQPPPMLYPLDYHRSDPRQIPPPPRHLDTLRVLERPPHMYGRPVEYFPVDPVVLPIHQPAPRQRTAVACRYCRRRKVEDLLSATDFRFGVQATKVRQMDDARTVYNGIKNANFYLSQRRLMTLPGQRACLT